MIAAAQAHLDAFFAAWKRHDPAAMAEFYASDAVMLDPTLTEPRVGRDAIRVYYADMFESLEAPAHDLLDFAVRDDRVWFEWSFAGERDVDPSERFRGVSVQTLRDGLIVHDHAFWDPNG